MMLDGSFQQICVYNSWKCVFCYTCLVYRDVIHLIAWACTAKPYYACCRPGHERTENLKAVIRFKLEDMGSVGVTQAIDYMCQE